MNDLVSIVMSTYNTPFEYLDSAIRSILDQTYKDLELIIVCDGIIEEYNYIKNNYKDQRIKLIFNSVNKGLPASLNEGIKNASGKYIIRMDSDDISLKDRIKIQVEFLEKNPKIQICGMYSKTFGDFEKKVKGYMCKPNEIEAKLLFTCCIVHPTVAIRRDFLVDNNIFYNEKFVCAQDYELWSRCSRNANIAIIPKYGLLYRVHEKQASQSKREKQIQLTKEILNNNARKITDNKVDNVVKCFSVMSYLEDFNKENYLDISNTIDYIIDQNSDIDEKALKRIMYNRYFFLLLKNKLLSKEFKQIFKNKNIRKKVFKFYNFKFILWGLLKRMGA